jgi:hypothetical protein
MRTAPRGPWWFFALAVVGGVAVGSLGSGCAASAPAAVGSATSGAREDDATCPDGAGCAGEDAESTDDGERYEAREEVMAAEARRKAQAFRDRLERLRDEEERRARERARRAQAEGAKKSQAALSALATSQSLADATEGAEAPRASARARLDEPEVPTSRPVERSRAGVAAAASGAPAADGFGPTPERLLRASACVLEREAEAAEQTMRATRARGASRQALGEWALAVVDIGALRADIDAELEHRGLANRPQVCAKPTDPVRALLRSLYGPGAAGDAGPRATARAVERLRRELEVRAGLPVPD